MYQIEKENVQSLFKKKPKTVSDEPVLETESEESSSSYENELSSIREKEEEKQPAENESSPIGEEEEMQPVEHESSSIEEEEKQPVENIDSRRPSLKKPKRRHSFEIVQEGDDDEPEH